jgi:hypothetical protein
MNRVYPVSKVDEGRRINNPNKGIRGGLTKR